MAKTCFLRSLRVDPEFKAPYICLGVVAIAQSNWSEAIRVSEAGLKRYPQAFHCAYHLGLALAHQLKIKLLIEPVRVSEHDKNEVGNEAMEDCDDIDYLQALAARSANNMKQAR